MKKNLTILLVSAIMVFSFSSLTSCGSKANESAQETPSKSGTDNGHTYIDLGLPSGTKWADRNIGASSSIDFGDYYAWGETSVKSNYSSDTYTTYKGDVAVEKWGGSWRMPSKEQFDELLKYTTKEWTIINGVNGRLFTAKNGNTIFLPAAGYREGTSLYDAGSYGLYWSRTLGAFGPYGAYGLGFDSGQLFVSSYCSRSSGLTVRPVRP